MKTVKLTVLFKSGIEKIYYDNCENNEEVDNIYSNFSREVGRDRYSNMKFGNAFIVLGEIASVEIEALE